MAQRVSWSGADVARVLELAAAGTRVTVKGRDCAYPRYQFSSRSDDIRRPFNDTRDALEIEWRRWGRWHVTVARRASVARMDEFAGPKA